MREYAGRAAIGHVRYATCGADDRSYAQPFERHHVAEAQVVQLRLQRPAGQLPSELREELLARRRQPPRPRDRHRNHHARDQPRAVAATSGPPLIEVMPRRRRAVRRGLQPRLPERPGRHARRPRSRWASSRCATRCEGPLFAAASESVALLNLGFAPENIKSLLPGQAVVDHRRASWRSSGSPPAPAQAHCFFEWIYFANVASTMDDRSVYLAAQGAGRGAGPAGDRADRRGHDRRAGARHQQGGGRRDGLPAEGAVRGRPDPQPLRRPHVHRGRRRPRSARRRRSTRRCARCSKASGCSWSKTRSSARRR